MIMKWFSPNCRQLLYRLFFFFFRQPYNVSAFSAGCNALPRDSNHKAFLFLSFRASMTANGIFGFSSFPAGNEISEAPDQLISTNQDVAVNRAGWICACAAILFHLNRALSIGFCCCLLTLLFFFFRVIWISLQKNAISTVLFRKICIIHAWRGSVDWVSRGNKPHSHLSLTWSARPIFSKQLCISTALLPCTHISLF